MELRAVRGMKEILPAEALRWQWIEQFFRRTVERFGYGEIRTPLLEPTELFVREIGDDTDVVQKEMYSFERHGDKLTVRPEGTAACARAYVQNAVHGREPVSRWYYIGPMFRAERPAKGRYRQFHQAGCEIYGDEGPACDAELIDLAAEVVQTLGIGDVTVHINSMGSGDTRQRYRQALADYFAPLEAELSEESQRRLKTNPLRILDSKAEQDQQLAKDAPHVVDLLRDEDARHFAELRRFLDAMDLPYTVDPTLVRGLDYYTRTLFEIKTSSSDLGAQNTLVGGGRYDNMIKNLGGKKQVPAIGFAMGIERLLLLTDGHEACRKPHCYLAPMNVEATAVALRLAKDLRRRDLYCELDGRGLSVKAMLRRANTLGSRLCVIIGENELERGVLTVKDLDQHQQEEIAITDAPKAIADRFGKEGTPHCP